MQVLIMMTVTLSRPSILMAQEEWEGRGEIEEAEVIIEKDREIILPRAGRFFDRVPEVPKQSGPLGLEYRFTNVVFDPDPRIPRVRPLTMQTPRLPLIKTNNVKLGFGNFLSPFVELNLGSGRNDEYLTNLYARHRSSANGPVNGENSGDSETVVDLNGSIFLNKATVSADLQYQHRGFTFYGYDPSITLEKDDIKQVLHEVTLVGSLENNLPESPVNYSVDGTLDYVTDYYQASEADFGINIKGTFPVMDDYKANLVTDFYMINRKDSLLSPFNRLFLRVKPFITYSYSTLDVDFGVSSVFEDDTLGGGKSVRVFPFIDINYGISDRVLAYGGYSGDVRKRSLKDNLNENRYLDGNVDVFHAVNTFHFYGGIKGTVLSNWSFDMGGELVYYKNQGYFINNPSDTSKFIIIYDTGTGNRNTIYASLGYNLKDNAYLGLRATSNFYSTSNVAEAWHLPTYTLNLTSQYTFVEKIKLGIDLYILGGIKARDPAAGSVVDLEPTVDAGASLEYIISPRASAFIRTFNILGFDNQRYLNYQTRSLQILGGVSYSF